MVLYSKVLMAGLCGSGLPGTRIEWADRRFRCIMPAFAGDYKPLFFLLSMYLTEELKNISKILTLS